MQIGIQVWFAVIKGHDARRGDRLKASVVVVDDQTGVVQALRNLLGPHGIQVRCSFTSAEEFLSEYRYDRETCLLLDPNLPGMDGLTLLKRLRRLDPTLPVILMSADAEFSQQEVSRRGAVAAVRKPFENSLVETILQIAGVRRSAVGDSAKS